MTERQSGMLSAALNARGYIVVALYKGRPRPEIGAIVQDAAVDGLPILQPVRIVAETTREDFMEQIAFYQASDWRCPLADDSFFLENYSHFYRVESD